MILNEYPSCRFASVTPSDTAKLSYTTQTITGDPKSPLVLHKSKWLWVGGVGNLVVKNDAGTSVTFTAVPAGTLLPIETDQVMSTNTTATAIVAIY